MVSFRKILVHTALTLTLVTPALSLAQTQTPAVEQQKTVQSPLDGVPLQGKIVETMDSNGYTSYNFV